MEKKEKQILTIIKYSPSLFIILLSIVLTLFLYLDSKKSFLEEKRNLEQNFIFANKEEIKKEVKEVYNFIINLQNSTEKELKSSIKNRVYEAHTIIHSIYSKYKETKSKEEILEIIKTSLENLRYNNNRGYFFIVDNNAVSILQPSIKKFENQNLFDFEDKKGYKFMQSIVETINQKSERFDEYYWKNPNSQEESSRKISFYKSFAPLNIAIGSGEYIKDFEDEIQQNALKYINLMNFSENSYIFIIDYSGIYLKHIRKEYIGKHAIENNDTVNIKEIISNLTRISKEGEGFYSYIQNKKPDTDMATKKISFVKGLNNWGWIIGTGFYEDEIKKEIKNKKEKLEEKFNSFAKNIIIISILLTLVLLFISKYISRFLEFKFNNYKFELEKNQAILYQQSKMAAMGEMIGNIAHQWKQPLSTISTSATGVLVSKKLNVLDDALLEDSLNKINNSTQYLSKTIDDFRDFFNPNKIKTTFSLIDTIEATLSLVAAQFSSQDIQLIKKVDDIKINSYENELIQALINILNNAKDELKKQDDTLDKKLVFINIYKENEELIIEIKDNAGGVKDNNIDKIFNPYFTTKSEEEGTGIGLYMTQEIIVDHLNGKIEVENKTFSYDEVSYKGAQFTIRLSLLP